ncbi:MAG: isocitrate lyase/phosphoenolpyruvate mutase family protein [Planctomycetota bacterium]
MPRSPLDRALALQTRLLEETRLLVVPGAWDVSSARIFAAQGAELLAISEEAIATTHGKPRLDEANEARFVARVESITQAVATPVCVDLGDGWGATAEALAVRVERILGSGAAAFQLGDASGETGRPLVDPSLQVERIQAMRERAEQFGHPLNLHAWTHSLRVGGRPDDAIEAITRCVRYGVAGATTVGVSGVADHDTIRRLLVDLETPLGVLADPTVAQPTPPSTGELEEWGVRRVDVGPAILHATLGLVRRAGAEFLGRGSFEHLRGEFRLGDARKARDSAILD